jgi:hypothetical protein
MANSKMSLRGGNFFPTRQSKKENEGKMTKGIIFCIITTFIGGIFGYFFGIYKERSNIKWKEKREALKNLYELLTQIYKYAIQGVSIQELTEIIDKSKNIIYKESSILPKKICKDLDEIFKTIITLENNPHLVILLADKIEKLRNKIKKCL